MAGLKPKDLVGIPWRVAFALQADGWWLQPEEIDRAAQAKKEREIKLRLGKEIVGALAKRLFT